MDAESGSDGQSQFGIRRILDCKISSDGRQMYQVEWETTWEPAESLITCQNLLDDFWSLINKAKSMEYVALQHRKPVPSSALGANSIADVKKLSEEDKDNVNKLIQRTLMTPTGSSNLRAPSEMLMSANTQSFSPCTQKTSFDTKMNDSIGMKRENIPKSKSSTASDGLKYIANFSNPYVKLIVVCKVCNKEQSLKHSHHWATHFKVHDKSLCHKCPYCPKTFQWPNVMRKHVEAKHPECKSETKTEESW